VRTFVRDHNSSITVADCVLKEKEKRGMRKITQTSGGG
jgi:hypothetical protein